MGKLLHAAGLLGVAVSWNSWGCASAASGVPSIDELSGSWVDPNAPVSPSANLGAEQRDLPTINNFWGAVGVAPQGTRPVDMFGINSLELPPYAGCGADAANAPFGCGRLFVDGAQVTATGTKWATHEATRRSDPLPTSGVVVSTATRMPFEQNGVFWVVNLSNPTTKHATVRVDIALPASVKRYESVGTWVYDVPADVTTSVYTPFSSPAGQKGVVACRPPSETLGRPTGGSHPACGRFEFVGAVQPDSVHAAGPPPPPSPPLGTCSIAGEWVQERSGDTFGPIVEDPSHKAFSWTGNPKYKEEGWNSFNGTLDGAGNIVLHYYRTYPGIPNPGVVTEKGAFTADCDHIKMADSPWHRKGSAPVPSTRTPVPNATFAAVVVPPGQTVSIKVTFAVGDNASAAEVTAAPFSGNEADFDAEWAKSHDNWQQRWAQAFEPNNGYWSGNLPTVSFPPSETAGAGVARVFYMSALTVVSQMRTNLPIVFERVWPNGNGNVGHTTMGIGGSRSWWWDEGLTSVLLALLEPASRAPTFQAWLHHDDHPGTAFGHGTGNGYAMDCAPPGSGSCFGSNSCGACDEPKEPTQGPEYGFYCYNPWAFYMAMANHLRMNNATSFLTAQAANSSMDVEAALGAIVEDYKTYLIPGTKLVDYGPAMDGFSPTYKHVMPGCSQGNNVYMLRDYAALKEAKGDAAMAADLRAQAAALAKATIDTMYTAKDGKGWFNIVFPVDGNKQIQLNEMRHVVDFFSVTFGLCGLNQDECDMTAEMRAELGAWFREESVTSNWIRATSPKCNCSNSWTVPINGSPSGRDPIEADDDDEWPAYSTCHAGRPDHGSNGAYPSWPAFSLEALCYVDGNCTSAFAIMSTFEPNTREGPFGQSNEVPQSTTSPYTPFNDEPAFKPIAGVNRYVAIEGGSFFDAIVRGFFGYHPPPLWAAGVPAEEALTAALHTPTISRGFLGSLSNLRTPHGLATITSGVGGLSIALQQD